MPEWTAMIRMGRSRLISFSMPQTNRHFRAVHIDLYQRAESDGRAWPHARANLAIERRMTEAER